MALLIRGEKKIIFNLYTWDIFNDQENFQTCNLNQSLIFEQNEPVVSTVPSGHLL